MTLERRDEIKDILHLKAPLCLSCKWRAVIPTEPICIECRIDHIFVAFSKAHNAVIAQLFEEIRENLIPTYSQHWLLHSDVFEELKQKYGGKDV